MKNALEIELRKLGRTLADKQIARFWKIPEAMQCTPCDFCGYNNVGRAILIEAKMVNRPRLPIGSEPGLTKNQWGELQDAERAGAISLVIWQREGFIVILHTRDVLIIKQGKSIPWDNGWINRADNLGALLEECFNDYRPSRQLLATAT